MLFEQSKKEFSKEIFWNPGACFRGTPFWSWNTLMTKEMIEEQIEQFRKMGMGGFHIHVRVGLRNQYMSDEFLELVRFADEKAREKGMLCWLYDEDRYSSGIAGGEVTKNRFFRARWLKLTARRQEGEEAHLLKAYDVTLEAGRLKRASVIAPDEEAEGVKWYLYLELAKESPWCNNQTYVDTLKTEAIASFIQLTHEKYAGILQDEFGKSVPAIFTDEPHINGLRLPDRADGLRDIQLAYTEELPQRYGTAEGKDFFASIPWLVWNSADESAYPLRYHYYKTLNEMFVNAYCRQIGDWCGAHGLSSTGHLLGEDSLRGQASCVGDAMRCYREFQIPGIDNLCDNRDFVAAKQVSSIAHQYRKEGVLSEMYGVTQWDFDFEGYKLAGDWQAALGINVRVPHLAWASMNGEAKRDYPAAIGWQSPWFEDYSYLENHFARVNYCLTRGKPVVRIGMIHTVESFWLLQGPADQCEGLRKQMEDDFRTISEWLLMGGMDFDYIAESSLADEGASEDDFSEKKGSPKFRCGDMRYDAVLVPSCMNLRRETVEKLSRFADKGGFVLFVGTAPEYVDCRKDEAASTLRSLRARCAHLPLSKEALFEALAAQREIDLLERGTKRTGNLLYQMRQEADCRWLFIAQAYRGMKARQDEVWYRRARHAPQELEIRIKGSWDVEKYDTLTGEIRRLPVRRGNGDTVVPYRLFGNDSLLLRLKAAQEAGAGTGCAAEIGAGAGSGQAGSVPGTEAAALPGVRELERVCLPEPAGYRMSEPNALLLDRFEYALDGDAYEEACEMLKLDNRVRERLGLPLRCEALAQPYIRIKEDIRDHKLHLRTFIDSTTELEGCLLALEEAEHCACTLNGEPVDMTVRGYYVDPAISVVKLPKLVRGRNELRVTMDYGDCSDPEWMYLLGDFGVCLQGAHTFLYPKPEKLYWGDYTRQGFPFYTGNMTYLVEFDGAGRQGGKKAQSAGPENGVGLSGGEGAQGAAQEAHILQIPYYSGAAVKASLNGGEERMLTFLPNECGLPGLKEKGNLLEITCLGNRYNGFGQLHLIGDDMFWLGQNSWRSRGTSWTDTYQVRPMGVLTVPHLIMREEIEYAKA